jgi:predicted permease
MEGQGPEPTQHEASVVSIHTNFFDTMEIPLKLGRSFTASDTQTSPPVAILNETLAKALFPNENPIGKLFAGGRNVRPEQRVEIVGVVADAKVNSLRDAPSPMFYRPILQAGFPSRTVVIRTAGDPAALLPAIRDAVRQIDPKLPLGQLSTQMERLEGSYLLNERIFALASSLFSGLALIIATIGLFSVMSYSVARRTKEIGIRMALGAQRDRVLKSVMREALLLVAIGVMLGLAGALALTRLIRTLLFGLAPHDPLTISIAVMVMIIISAAASYLPARRASRIDPMVALRYE